MVLKFSFEKLSHSRLGAVLGWSDVLIIDHRILLLISTVKYVFDSLKAILVGFFSTLQHGALRRGILRHLSSADIVVAAVTAAAGIQGELLLGGGALGDHT